MINEENLPDPYLEEVRAARDAAAVLKIDLAHLRARFPDVLIFAFEGIDDKSVYAHWIRNIDANLYYESFVCSNKSRLLKLLDVVRRDQTNIGENIYFFVDRDFDDLQERETSEMIFLTERYSIENYIVTRGVLEAVLRDELHCHGAPEVRGKIQELFQSVYSDFVKATTKLNFRIFLARKCHIRQIRDLPDRVNKIASVSIDGVVFTAALLEEIVALQREPTHEEIGLYNAEFSSLEPFARYRGKFALLFFQKWLSLLMEERNRPESQIFIGLAQGNLVARGPFSLGALASKSDPPQELYSFLARFSTADTQTALAS